MDTPQQKDNFEQFVDELIEQKGYQDLTPGTLEEMRRDIRKRIDDFIMARAIAAFSDEDMTDFEKLLAEKKPRNELHQFAAEHIQDFTSFLTNVLIEFQSVYLASSPGMKK